MQARTTRLLDIANNDKNKKQKKEVTSPNKSYQIEINNYNNFKFTAPNQSRNNFHLN